MSHTPGPWLPIKWENGHFGIFSEVGNNELVSRTDGAHIRRVEANARLMSASPEMVELLKYILRNRRALGGLGGVPGLEGYIHQVISKALGGPSEPSIERQQFVLAAIGEEVPSVHRV